MAKKQGHADTNRQHGFDLDELDETIQPH